MPGSIGLPEIAIVLVIALIVFGPKRLPELGNSLGKGFREFKSSISGEDERPAGIDVSHYEDDADDDAVTEDQGPAAVETAEADLHTPERV